MSKADVAGESRRLGFVGYGIATDGRYVWYSEESEAARLSGELNLLARRWQEESVPQWKSGGSKDSSRRSDRSCNVCRRKYSSVDEFLGHLTMEMNRLRLELYAELDAMQTNGREFIPMAYCQSDDTDIRHRIR
jgi:hypothetical protein